MSKASFTSSRLLDDDDMPPPQAVPGTPWDRPRGMRQPPQEPRRLAAPSPAQVVPPPLLPAQRACYDTLGLALEEGHVFATVTGPEGSGKSTVLQAVLADRRDRTLRCIRISHPDKVPARLADQIEQVAYAEAGKPENLDRHVVLAVDDAHTASDDLLVCLTRLAAMREPGRRVPQILLVGRPELWNRLAGEQYAPLARRLAIRVVLPPLEAEEDPWISLEREVSQTMSQIQAESELLPARLHPTRTKRSELEPLFERDYTDPHYPIPVSEAGLPLDPETVPPPTDFALFPDPPPRAPAPPQERDLGRRLLLPLGCLLVAFAAFAFVLSFYDWPNPFDDVPLANTKPAEPFSFSPPSDPAEKPPPPSPPHLAPRPAPPKPAAASPAPIAPTPIVATPIAPTPIVAPPITPPHTSPAPVIAPAPLPPPAAAAPKPEAHAAQAATPAPSPIAPQAAAPPPAPPHPARPTPIAVVRPAPLSPSIVALLLHRGETQLALGDVSAARLLFERAAEAGSGVAARRLARTYDPAFLPAADVSVLGNRNAARAWYVRAAALGDREAKARLRDMNEGR